MDAKEATWHKEMWNGQVKQTDMGTNVFCDVTPHIMLNSHGVWEKLASGSTGMSFWEYPLPKIEISILSAFLGWRFFDILFKKLGVPIPRFTSMMLVGALLSESFQSSKMAWFKEIFVCDIYVPRVAENIGTFAFVLNWFLRGVTTNMGMVKSLRSRSTVIGVTSMIIPWYIGKLVYSSRDKSSILTMTKKEYSTIIFITNMAPFTCINMFLTDLKIVHTEFGQIAQSSAMIADVLAFTMSIWSNVSREYHHGMRLGVAFMVYFIFLYLVRQAMLWVVRHTPEGSPVKNIYIYIGLMLAYLSYLYWTHFLYFGPLGAFILGLAIPEGPPLGSVFIRRFDSFNEGLFLPLFGALTMIKLDWSFIIEELGTGHFNGHTYEFFSFLFMIYIAKFTTAFSTAVASKMPLRDSAILGIIMGTKSSFELAYVLYAFEKNMISLEIFTLMGIYILVNSLLTPLSIHFLYDREKRFTSYGERNLQNKPELQVLVCINKPDHITSMISLLRTTAPSKDSTLSCSVLHLLELVGEATPTFISHQLQKPKPGTRSYSENVISSFQMFQDMHRDYTYIHMFTSLTSAKEMHEHICRFALDKSSNLILLSFHRTWGANGSGVISDDETLRNLNRNVLKRAPCSVGILVYRNPIWQPKSVESPCRVCLIYVGGNDDMEALALADHMRGNLNVSLTVLSLIPKSNAEEVASEWSESEMGDTCRVEERPGENSITYITRMVAEGGETSKILHSVAYDYDMFLVGRSCGNGTEVTRGLSDWMEFEELGVIGDLLASEDFPSRASVLVLQQQESS